MIQGGIRRMLIQVVRTLPETSTAAANVPVAQVVQELVDGQRGAVHVGIRQTLCTALRHLVQTRKNPDIERIVTGGGRAFRLGWLEAFAVWLPAIEIGIGHEK